MNKKELKELDDDDHGPRAHNTRSGVNLYSEDQGVEQYNEAADDDNTEKRWGNRLNWIKKWGNRVGRGYNVGDNAWSKRWGSRVCLQAHCGSLSSNRHAYVACGRNFCNRRRR